MDEVKQIASEMVEEKSSPSEEVTKSVGEFFKVDYFLFILDQSRYSFQTIFEQLKHYEEIIGFLFNLARLNSTHIDGLLKSCANLEQYLNHNGYSNIIGDGLCSELMVLRCYLSR